MSGRAERAKSFGRVAADYHRYRPRTPPELLDWLLPPHPAVLLELAAGTGVQTELLLSRAATVIAVEPDDAMRAMLAAVAPGAQTLPGRAEDIPLADATVDVVFAASAWHWFDHERATAEIARVLRDGGRLVLAGNSPDHAVDWVAAMRRPLANADQPDPRPRDTTARIELPAGAPFSVLEERFLHWTWSLPVADVLGLLSTYSQMIIASGEERERLNRHALDVLAAEPATAGRPVIELPMVSRGLRAGRLRRANAKIGE